MTTPASSQLPAYIRTYIPLLVLVLSGELAKHGIGISSDLLTMIVGAVVAAAYYALVRYLEKHSASFGWLLGMAKQPAYSAEPAPAPADGQTVEAVTVPSDPPENNTDPATGPTD